MAAYSLCLIRVGRIGAETIAVKSRFTGRVSGTDLAFTSSQYTPPESEHISRTENLVS